jgi:hypothetical protein
MPYNRTAGGALTQDFINASILNDLDVAHQIAASGAIDPHTPSRYIITKAGVAAMTLAAPIAGAEDGLEIQIISATANAHTITATGLFNDGAGHANLATFAAQPGAGTWLVAWQGKWLVEANNNVTYS